MYERRLCHEGTVMGVYLDELNKRREVYSIGEPVTESFTCTGSEHSGGEVIHCTDSSHLDEPTIDMSYPVTAIGNTSADGGRRNETIRTKVF